jgi:polyhydroxyalkanoate synthase
VLSLLYAAGHTHDPVRSFAFVATPVDFTQMGVLVDVVRQKRIDPDDLIDDTGNVPADVVFDGFRLREPIAELTTYVNLWENLWNSEFVKAHQTIGMWGRDHIPFPGVCFKQTLDLFGRKNLLATGRVPLRNRTVDLADITKPALCAYAEKDSIVPAAAATPLTGVLTGSAGLEQYRAPCGHIGLFVGRSAHRRHIPALADWFEKHSEKL